MIDPKLRADFLQLNQGAVEILGVKEDHWLSMGANLGCAIAQNTRAIGLQSGDGSDNIRHFEADMVHPT